MNTKKLKALIADYVDVKSKRDIYTQKEREMRLEIISAMFDQNQPGTQKQTIDETLVKATFGYSFKIDQKKIESIKLTKAEKNCIRTKYEVSVREYKALDPELRINLDTCVEIKPDMPSLTITSVEAE